LKVNVDAYIFLRDVVEASRPQFLILALYPEKYLETKAVGFEVAMNVIKINSNILMMEYLRHQSKNDEIGKYAKAIVSQALIVETLLKQHTEYVDKKLLDFVVICHKLYKAVALWSLLTPITARIKTEKYEKGEDFRKLATACMGLVNFISALHRDILLITKVKESPYYQNVELYFGQVFVPKCKEVSNLYAQAFSEAQYDESHFQRMTELDYMSVTVGDKK